ncbi:MAG: hypothetical protein N2255_05455 [Kiritimatiellae bacterium]|nr:hypothetical protein [Kiritimatiellia bacterium]
MEPDVAGTTSHLWTIFINVHAPPEWLLEELSTDNNRFAVFSFKWLSGTEMSLVRESPTLGTVYGEEMQAFLSREPGKRLSDEILTLALSTYKTAATGEVVPSPEYDAGMPPKRPPGDVAVPSSTAAQEGEAGGTRLGLLNLLLAVGILSILALKVRQ